MPIPHIILNFTSCNNQYMEWHWRSSIIIAASVTLGKVCHFISDLVIKLKTFIVHILHLHTEYMLSCVTRSYFKWKYAAFQKLYICLWGVLNHSDIFVLQENDHKLVYLALYGLPWENDVLFTVSWEVCRKCCVFFNLLSHFIVYVCTYGAYNILFQHLI